MKNLLLFALLSMLTLVACETDPTPGKGSGNNPSVLNPNDVKNSALEMTGRMKYVVGHIWWYEGYVTGNPEYKSEQRGKWFQFSPDGSFVYGKWQDQLDSGTWRYDEESETLYLANPGGSENLEWKTMMSHTNDQMVWLGPPRGANNGDQCMLRPYLQRPNPADLPAWTR